MRRLQGETSTSRNANTSGAESEAEDEDYIRELLIQEVTREIATRAMESERRAMAKRGRAGAANLIICKQVEEMSAEIAAEVLQERARVYDGFQIYLAWARRFEKNRVRVAGGEGGGVREGRGDATHDATGVAGLGRAGRRREGMIGRKTVRMAAEWRAGEPRGSFGGNWGSLGSGRGGEVWRSARGCRGFSYRLAVSCCPRWQRETG